MSLFSERYGYTNPSSVIKRECFPNEVANAVCTCLDKLNDLLSSESYYSRYNLSYEDVERYIWIYFLNKRQNDFYIYNGHRIVAVTYLQDKNVPWYKKLDLIEAIIKFLKIKVESKNLEKEAYENFIQMINIFFSRLHYSYKIINNEVVEISSEDEVMVIEKAIADSQSNIRTHLSAALSLYAKKPVGDYRNSIKESISAVEAYCREKTGEQTLGKALNKMESTGKVFPKMLKDTFEKLYAYTNQPENGIRHALMDEDGKYTPGPEEALFMLVSCSSFLNYLKKKE